MKKICTVVGARPQFVKLAVISKQLRKTYQEVIIHTGQHYDYNMSDVFFEEMGIPHPDYNLGIFGGTHGHMTGLMISGIENILNKEKPDMLLVFGDTNSTMAAALAAVKLNVPVCHVEAGNRLGTLSNPEEVNRIVTDHISQIHLTCTESASENLVKEGFSNSVHLVGDPMYDAFLYYSLHDSKAFLHEFKRIDDIKIKCPEDYYYLTCHRQENTNTDEKINNILHAMNLLDAPTIYPVHPRNREKVIEICQINDYKNIILIEPVGYLDSIFLVNNAKKIVTDSGGLQREAFFAKKQCVTIFDYVIWPETMKGHVNQLAKPIEQDILEKLGKKVSFDIEYQPFGDGHSANRIVDEIGRYFG